MKAIGLAMFGPLDLNPKSSTFGFVLSTPKPGWSNFNVLGFFRQQFSVPVVLQTDVNAPALSEMELGGHGDISSCAYITVGTGVGVGIVSGSRAIYGVSHPEGGHIKVGRYPGDTFEGTCPFHGDCIEGLVSTGAIAARLKISRKELAELKDDHPVWDLVAFYLGSFCMTLLLVASPEKIVIGGGVLNRGILYGGVRSHFLKLLNDYMKQDQVSAVNIGKYIVSSRFGSQAGAIGSLYLAKKALSSDSL